MTVAARTERRVASASVEVTAEMMDKIRRVLSAVQSLRKVEVDTATHTIKAWSYDPGNGRRAVCIQIEEG